MPLTLLPSSQKALRSERGAESTPKGNLSAVPTEDILGVLDYRTVQRVGDAFDLQGRMATLQLEHLSLGFVRADRFQSLKSSSGSLAVAVLKQQVERATKVVFDQAGKTFGREPRLLERNRTLICKPKPLDSVTGRTWGDFKELGKLVTRGLLLGAQDFGARAKTIILELLSKAGNFAEVTGYLWSLHKGAAAAAQGFGDQTTCLEPDQGVAEGHARNSKMESEFTFGWQTITTVDASTRNGFEDNDLYLLVGGD